MMFDAAIEAVRHEPKIEWDDMSEEDTVDILTMISLIHRKLDRTVRT